MPIDEIMTILSERGSDLNRDDLARINELALDVPLEDTEQLGTVWEGIALIVNDPLYSGDIDPID